MKLFPINKYELKLKRESSKALSELENKTLSKEQFVKKKNIKKKDRILNFLLI